MPEKTNNKKMQILLLTVLLAAALLRFYGLDWGTDHLTGKFHAFHPDETTIIDNSRWVNTDLRKIVAPYGNAPMYILWGVANTVGSLIGIDPFDLTNNTTARFTYCLARALSALLGLLTVWLCYKIGDHLAGPWVGLLSAFFLAFSPGHIQQSHYYTVEVPFTFWVTLSIYLMQEMPSASRRTYIACGLAGGLAAGTRLAGLWLILPFAIAQVWNGKSITDRLNHLATIKVGYFLLAVLVVASVCEPFLLLDPAHYFKTDTVLQISSSIKVATGESIHVWTLSDFSTLPYLFHLTDLLPYAVGLPLELAAGIGIALLAWYRRESGFLILSWCAFYFLVIGRLHSKPVRYIVPMIPALAIFGSWACWQSIIWLRRHWGPYYLPALLVICPTLAYGVGMMRIYREEDSRISAARWIQHNVPSGANVLTERGGYPTSWMAPPDRYNGRLDDATYYIRAAGGILFRDQIAHLRRKIEGTDWIIIIEENRMRQFVTVPEKFPIPYTIYRKLASGELGYDLVTSFKVSPGVFGWTRSEDGAETTQTAFDHPRVMIYQRREDANPEGLLNLWSHRLDNDPRLPDRHILEGFEAYATEDWASALAAFTRAAEVRTDHILSRVLQRMTYLRMRRNTEAKKMWEELRNMGYSGLISSAVGLSHAGYNSEAAEFLIQFTTEVTDDHVSLVDAYQKLSKLLIRLERWNENVRAIQELVNLDAARHQAWNLLAVAYQKNGQIQEAISAVDKALLLNPEWEAYQITKMNLATTLLNRGDSKEALDLYQQVLGGGSEMLNLHYNMGLAYHSLGNHDKAIHHFRTSTKRFPNEAKSHRALGFTYIAVNKNLEAARALTRALELDPDDTQIKETLGTLSERDN